MMANAHEQYASGFDTSSVIKNLFTASATYARRDPCRAAIKGFRAATHATSSPIVNTSHLGKKHKHEQNIVSEIFYRNPTPTRIKTDEDDDGAPEIPIQSTTASNAGTAVSFAQHISVAVNPPVKLYSQLLEMLKTIKQAAPQTQKLSSNRLIMNSLSI
jgi:hypothetical protein